MNNDLPGVTVHLVYAALPNPPQEPPSHQTVAMIAVPIFYHLHNAMPPQDIPSSVTSITSMAIPSDRPHEGGGTAPDLPNAPENAAPKEVLPLHKGTDQANNFKLLEKFLNIFPFRFAFAQPGKQILSNQESKSSEELFGKVPQNKGQTIARGEHVESAHKIVAEEIEMVSQAQTDMRSDPQYAKPFQKEAALNPAFLLPKDENATQNSTQFFPRAANHKQEAFQQEDSERLPEGLTPARGREGSRPAEAKEAPLARINHPEETAAFLRHPQEASDAQTRSQGIPQPQEPLQLHKQPEGFVPLAVAPVSPPPPEPIRPISPAAESIRPVEALGGQDVKARSDIAFQPNAEAPQAVPQKADDRDIVRVPVQPDQPFSRDTLFHKGGSAKFQKLLEDEGHRLGDLILMVLCALSSGAKSVGDIVGKLEMRADFYKVWLGLKSGLPSHRLLTILLGRLLPGRLQKVIEIALGKTAGSWHQLRVWESDRGLVLGQLSNELSVFHAEQAIELFDFQDAIVTLGMPASSSDLANRLFRRGAGYFACLNSKQGPIYGKALEFFESTLKEQRLPHAIHREVHESSQYAELREILITDELEWVPGMDEWQGLRTAVKLKSELIKGHRTLIEQRMYLSSLPMDAPAAARSLRLLTMIEARVHWSLDVDFSSWKINYAKRNLDQLGLFCKPLQRLKSLDKMKPDEIAKKLESLIGE